MHNVLHLKPPTYSQANLPQSLPSSDLKCPTNPSYQQSCRSSLQPAFSMLQQLRPFLFTKPKSSCLCCNNQRELLLPSHEKGSIPIHSESFQNVLILYAQMFPFLQSSRAVSKLLFHKILPYLNKASSFQTTNFYSQELICNHIIICLCGNHLRP